MDALDRALMYFIQMRHSWSDYMLGVFFGVSNQSSSNYIDEVALKMQEKFVPTVVPSYTPGGAALHPPRGHEVVSRCVADRGCHPLLC